MEMPITQRDKAILRTLGLAGLIVLVTLIVTLAFGIRDEVFITDSSGLLPADEIGVVIDDKATVVEVIPGSAAEKAGFKVSDKIQEVDGVALDTAAKVNKALQDKLAARQKDKFDQKPLKPLPILVERNGVMATVNITAAAPTRWKIRANSDTRSHE